MILSLCFLFSSPFRTPLFARSFFLIKSTPFSHFYPFMHFNFLSSEILLTDVELISTYALETISMVSYQKYRNFLASVDNILQSVHSESQTIEKPPIMIFQLSPG